MTATKYLIADANAMDEQRPAYVRGSHIPGGTENPVRLPVLTANRDAALKYDDIPSALAAIKATGWDPVNFSIFPA